VVDGELVVWSDDRLDFGALGPRLAYRGRRRTWHRRLSWPSTSWLPATSTVRGEPLRVWRSLLESLAESWRPPLQLMPQTRHRSGAAMAANGGSGWLNLIVFITIWDALKFEWLTAMRMVLPPRRADGAFGT